MIIRIHCLALLSDILLIMRQSSVGEANQHARRLYDDLMVKYNRASRPVNDSSKAVTVKLSLSLSQLVNLIEKDEIMVTRVWLLKQWNDYRLTWNPTDYGNITTLYIPAEFIWVPDVNLYNMANGTYSQHLNLKIKCTVTNYGLVRWKLPALFKTTCPIDVEWFPFDEQRCSLKFGSWSYTEEAMDLQHMRNDVHYAFEYHRRTDSYLNVSVVYNGVDLSEYYPSVSWDIIEVSARRHREVYPSCCSTTSAFIDITFCIVLRRKPLFYVVNLVVPCIGTSLLAVCSFYLPTDCGKRMHLAINVLVVLFVFYILLMELIPTNSEVLPIIGKYLVFILILICLSVATTACTMNFRYRSITDSKIPRWVRITFLETLPKYLLMPRPGSEHVELHRIVCLGEKFGQPGQDAEILNRKGGRSHLLEQPCTSKQSERNEKVANRWREINAILRSELALEAYSNIEYIANLIKRQRLAQKISNDWNFVGLVMDRLCAYVFTTVLLVGSTTILLQAPTFYSDQPIHPDLITVLKSESP